MAHLSKQQLKPEHLNQLFSQLASTVAKLDKRTATYFLDELLGPEEKIMLAKRLAAVVMFIEGNSSYRVWQLLKMSPSTADRIRLQYEIGKYKNIEAVFRQNKTNYHEFWRTLEIILQAGLPPRGRGRWKSVFEEN